MLIQDKIKKILTVKKWTQTRLAKELGISASRLNNWYNDKNSPVADWVIEKLDKLYEACVKFQNGILVIDEASLYLNKKSSIS